MKITTVLLDAGGVILDESDDEKARVGTAVRVLRRVVPGYSVEMLYGDLKEAIEMFCPRILAYAFWKRLKPDRSLFDELYRAFMAEWRGRRPPLRLMPGLNCELEAIAANRVIIRAGVSAR